MVDKDVGCQRPFRQLDAVHFAMFFAPMAMTRETLESLLTEAFPDADITLTDLAGDDNHWQADIVSPQFAGVPRVKQHQMVYAALKGKVGNDGDELHALALKTRAPGS